MLKYAEPKMINEKRRLLLHQCLLNQGHPDSPDKTVSQGHQACVQVVHPASEQRVLMGDLGMLRTPKKAGHEAVTRKARNSKAIDLRRNLFSYKRIKSLLTGRERTKNKLRGFSPTANYSETSIYRSRIYRSISVVPKQILFKLWK
jgi:hypothetical protein